MDAVGAAVLAGAGALFTGTLAPTVLYITSRLDRKARQEAEEREQQALTTGGPMRVIHGCRG